jgi:hypothetical protein
MARGPRIFWLVLVALLGASAWFGAGVVRMKAGQAGESRDSRENEEARK